MQADLVPPGRQPVTCTVLAVGIVPTEAQDRPGGVTEVGFGDREGDPAIGIPSQRTHPHGTARLVQQMNAEDGWNLGHQASPPSSSPRSTKSSSYAVRAGWARGVL